MLLFQVDYFFKEHWPSEQKCYENFTALFEPPSSYIEDHYDLANYFCLLTSLVTGESEIEEVEDPLIQTVV